MTQFEPSILLENVSKYYRLYSSPLERLKDALTPFCRSEKGMFHALSDVSLTISKGETWGVIGLNGSGKSTLLKIICRVTQPTCGRVEVRGEVSALLELGAGFNPEFTGRENVFFSGAIAGLLREQIEERFEDIAKFAGIGEFMDQPVKSYSSGMLVRLAFAVAISVDPDVLIIDEALAVGDAPFQHKCMARIEQFKGQSAILFVSHDMSAVTAFCDKVVWLHHGRVQRIGPPKEVVEEYLEAAYANGSPERLKETADWSVMDSVILPEGAAVNSSHEAFGTGGARILGARLYASGKSGVDVVKPRQEVALRLWIHFTKDVSRPIVGFIVKNRIGLEIFGYNNLHLQKPLPSAASGDRVTVDFTFVWPDIAPGSYSITAAVADGVQDSHEQLHWVHNMIVVECFREGCITGLLTADTPRFSIADAGKE